MTADQTDVGYSVPAQAVPEPGTLTIGALVSRAAETFGDREALGAPTTRLSFRQVRQRAEELARGLIAGGVNPDDRVAVLMPNRIDVVPLLLATAMVGCVLVPLNTASTRAELAGMLSRCGAKLLVAGGRHKDRDLAAEAAAVVDEPALRRCRLVTTEDPECRLTDLALPPDPTLDDEVRDRSAAVRPADACLLLYSSGTSGTPKGVLHSHRMLDNVIRAGLRQRLGPDDVLVHYLPLFHIFGITAALSMLWVGGRVFLMPRFDADASLRHIAEEGATLIYGIGTMYFDQLASASLASHDRSRIRLCLVSGHPDLVRRVDASMGPAIGVWGMTEASGTSTLPRLEDPIELRATNGLPIDGVSLRVIDDAGRVVPAGTRGELQVRSLGMMLGYDGDPQATAAALRDGWLRTGDLALLREDGYLCFLGRLNDRLRVGGEMVDAMEVEAVLSRHPAVFAAAVIGVPHERLGEVPYAFVRLHEGSTVDATELVSFAERSLAPFKVPRTVEFVDTFPTTESGKIRKGLLRPRLGGPDSVAQQAGES